MLTGYVYHTSCGHCMQFCFLDAQLRSAVYGFGCVYNFRLLAPQVVYVLGLHIQCMVIGSEYNLWLWALNVICGCER